MVTADATGPRDSITDVAGVQVGHYQRLDEHWATGTSVVLTPGGAVAAVDVRGGGPGTRETDVLAPSHLVQRAHAVVLTGGSAYGLAAADGVMRWLGERGYGFPISTRAEEVVPIVPAAVLFDLPMGDWGNWPETDFGYLACDATALESEQGNVGAGTGAVSGTVKGGVGTASKVLDDGTIVGALVAVNSSGSVINPGTGLPWDGDFGLRAPNPSEVAAARDRQRPSRGPVSRPLNTTIGVVATDASLTKPDCQRVAVAGQDGLARAIRPAHAMSDGDTIFALATGGGRPEPGTPGWVHLLDAVCSAAADVVSRAIGHAVLAADSIGEVTSYTDLYPSVRE